MYKIVRFYYIDKQGNHKSSRTIETGLTLNQVQKHCSNPKTCKDGIYFDGYTEM